MSTLRKAREKLVTKARFVLVLVFSFSFGWVISASFLDQSQSEVKQNQSNSG